MKTWESVNVSYNIYLSLYPPERADNGLLEEFRGSSGHKMEIFAYMGPSMDR